jgi:hypothetical protein
LFSTITKCTSSFSNSKVRKEIVFSHERTSIGKEAQPSIGLIYQGQKKEGGGPKEGGGVPKEDDGGGSEVR